MAGFVSSVDTGGKMKAEVTIEAVKCSLTGEAACKKCIFYEVCEEGVYPGNIISETGLYECDSGYIYRIKQPLGKNNKRSNFLKVLDRMV